MKKLKYKLEIAYKSVLIVFLCYVGNLGYRLHNFGLKLYDWSDEKLLAVSKYVKKP